MTADHELLWHVKKALTLMEELHPALNQLSGKLREYGVELGDPIPGNGSMQSIEDYARAIIGLAKFLDAIGRALMRMADASRRD